MLAYFYIPRLSNNMQIAVQKNRLEGLILYRRWNTSKKRRTCGQKLEYSHNPIPFLALQTAGVQMPVLLTGSMKPDIGPIFRSLCKIGHMVRFEFLPLFRAKTARAEFGTGRALPRAHRG